MKILYVCWLDPATTDLPLFMARAWQNAGHEVQLFPYDLEFSNRASSEFRGAVALGNQGYRLSILEQRISSRCMEYRPDVLLFGHPFISPDGMQKLQRKYGCVLGYFLGYNNLLEGHTVAAMRVADFVIVHDSYVIPIVQGSRFSRVPHVFLLLCMADPLEHRPLDLSVSDRLDYGPDVAFIGGAGTNRIEALSRLTHHDLRIWGGSAWAKIPQLSRFYSDEPVYGLKKSKIYNGAKIVLNIEDDEKQINAISNRVPEVLACGGFVVTEWRRDLERTELVDGESIATYRSLPELSEKVEYYLRNPAERQRIIANGQKIVLESLTYDCVAGAVIREIASVFQARLDHSF